MADGWTRISSGRPGPAFLAIDFDLTSRRDAGFRDLVKLFPEPLNVFQTAQPSESFRKFLPVSRYLDWWHADPSISSAGIGGILGYCAGATFVPAMADEIEYRQGTRPMAILFNPGKPDLATLIRDFRMAVTALSPLTPTEQEMAWREAEFLTGHEEEFRVAADHIMLLYSKFSQIAFARLGIDNDVGESLAGVFRSYLSYLCAARELEYQPGCPAATALHSAEWNHDAELTPRARPFPVSRDDLLRTPAVAELTFDMLTAEE